MLEKAPAYSYTLSDRCSGTKSLIPPPTPVSVESTGMIKRLWHTFHASIAMGPLSGLRFWRLYGLRKIDSPNRELIALAPWGIEHPIFCRPGTSDLWVCWQIFVERMYDPSSHLNGVNLIIDCGANVGLSAVWFLNAYPKAKVLAIEPDPRNFDLLKQHLQPYEDRATLIHGAVWNKSEPLVIANPNGSMHAIKVRKADRSEVAQVQGYTIPELLEIANESVGIVLKVDIEGAESQLFSESAPWLHRFDHIAIELHGEQSRTVFMDAIEEYAFDLTEKRELMICERQRGS
jgi:FkbM family methyltransferase